MSTGTMERPARKISATKGVHCQMSITTMAMKAPVGLPSQSDRLKPSQPRSWFATPKSRLKMRRPMSPTTA